LDRKEQLRHCLIETPADEMRAAYTKERRAEAGAGAEAQCGLMCSIAVSGLPAQFLRTPLQGRLDDSSDIRRHLVLGSNTSSSMPSKRSGQRSVPLSASINCAVIRTRPPALRTDPSST
jgi:hypothetical protein